jgi:outer membrane protein assembly factor BamB
MPFPVRSLALLLVALPLPLSLSLSLSLAAPSVVSAQLPTQSQPRPQPRSLEDEPEAQESPEGTEPGSGKEGARPPDGILPVAEIARLPYGPSDRPQVEIVGSALIVSTASGLVEEHDALSGELEWKLGAPEATFFRPLLLSSDPVELFVASPSGHVLRIRGSDGELSQELQLSSPIAVDPLVAGTIAFVGTPGGEVIAYEIATGSERFRVDAGETPAALSIDRDLGLLVISGSERTLTAVDVERGNVRWTFRGRAGFHAPAAFGEAGDRLYVGDDAGDFYCLSTKDGKARFRWSTGGAVRARPLVEGNRVYVTTYGNELYAYDANGGAEQWRVSVPGRPAGAAIRVHHRLLVFTYDGLLAEVDPEKGQMGKTWAAPGELASTPAVLVAPSPPSSATEKKPEAPATPEDSDSPPDVPKWFECHRIALPLRTGEVLLLGYKPPEAKPEPEPKPKPGEAGPDVPKPPPQPRSASEPFDQDTLSRKEDPGERQTLGLPSGGVGTKPAFAGRRIPEVLTPSENDG